MIFAEYAARSNCWNVYESYGQICVGCGCCSKDKTVRYESRLEVLRSMLDENLYFDRWYHDDPEMMEIQKKNICSNIKYFRRKIAYYERKLKELKLNNETITNDTI